MSLKSMAVDIVVFNVGGNFYTAQDYVNKHALAEFVVQFHFTGSSTLVVLKMPIKTAAEYRKAGVI